MTHARKLIASMFLVIAGCGVGDSKITASPANWSEYADHEVTVRGNAGNSGQGPIVRLADGGYIGLLQRAPWGIDIVGKPVDVTGKIVSGKNVRAEPYVLDMTAATLVPPPDESAAKAAP